EHHLLGMRVTEVPSFAGTQGSSMFKCEWRHWLRQFTGTGQRLAPPRRPRRGATYHPRLEEFETRLAPARFTVSAELAVAWVDSGGGPNPSRAVVFFDSAVANYQSLEAGLAPGTDAVVLDSRGDGLQEMAAFLAGRHDLTAVHVVAHGAPGRVTLGT